MNAVATLSSPTAPPALGMLVAMDRRPMAAADAGRVLMLTVVAARAAAEIERARTDETLRAVALGVSATRGGSVFDELVRLLVTILQVDVAFVAQPDPALAGGMRMLAMYCGGRVLQDIPYPLAERPAPRSWPALPRLSVRRAGAVPGRPGPARTGQRRLRRPSARRRGRHRAGHRRGGVAPAAGAAGPGAGHAEDLRRPGRGGGGAAARRRGPEAVGGRPAPAGGADRAIFEGSLDGLFLWDEELRVVDVNPAGLALYGQPQRHRRCSFPSYMPKDYVRGRLDMVRRALAGQSTHVETTVLRPNGSTFEADLRVMPFAHRGRPARPGAARRRSGRRDREPAWLGRNSAAPSSTPRSTRQPASSS